MRRTLGFAVFLFAVGCLVGHVCGCHPAVVESVENAAAVAQYKALMADCRKKGKAAKDYEVYDACADEVDRMLCRESALRCPDGGQ